jgi:hypothetical protein
MTALGKRNDSIVGKLTNKSNKSGKSDKSKFRQLRRHCETPPSPFGQGKKDK